ncbi:NUDIX domain-containing protein [Candidatus Saccharibacteria bacterium]|nr:NUDIX domain-containing protein [Candidatus Saccharibacteria bacterium]
MPHPNHLQEPTIQLEIPDRLRPEAHPGKFPDLTFDDLQSLKSLGWSRVGAAAIFVDPNKNVLVLEHRPDGDKILECQWGVMTETCQEGDHYIENPLETLVRGIKEELRIDPYTIKACVDKNSPWFVHQFPVGGKHENEFVFGICSVIFVDENDAELLTQTDYTNHLEIVSSCFRPLVEIYNLPLRAGIEGCLNQIENSGLLDSTELESLPAWPIFSLDPPPEPTPS